jgi:hypothetical protein
MQDTDYLFQIVVSSIKTDDINHEILLATMKKQRKSS